MVSDKLDCHKCGFEIDANTTHYCPSCGAPVEGFKKSGEKQGEKQHDNKKRGVQGWLSHPFVILLGGAIITSILIPQLTSSWQVNERELDLKFQLASQLVNQLSDTMGAIVWQHGELGSFSDEVKERALENLSSVYRGWLFNCGKFVNKVDMYYPDNAEILNDAIRLCDNVTNLTLSEMKLNHFHNISELKLKEIKEGNQNLLEKIYDSNIVGFKRGIFQ